MRFFSGFFTWATSYVRRIQFSILFSFFAFMVITCGAIIFYSYNVFFEDMVLAMDDRIDAQAEISTQRIQNFLGVVRRAAESNSWVIPSAEKLTTERESIAHRFIGLLKVIPHTDAFTLGLEDGRAVSVRRVQPGSSFQRKGAVHLPAEVRFRYLYVDANLQETYRYYDKDGVFVAEEYVEYNEEESSARYDARKRPWYVNVKRTQVPALTDLYLFFSNAEIGVTLSYPVFDAQSRDFLGVVGVDVNINSLSDIFKVQSGGEVALACLFQRDGKMIAYPDITKIFSVKGNKLEIKNISQIKDFSLNEAYARYKKTGINKIMFASDGQYVNDIAYFTPFKDDFWKGYTLGIVFLGDRFLSQVNRVGYNALLFSFVMILFSLVLMILVSRQIAWPIEVVAGVLKRIQKLDLDLDLNIHSKFTEIAQMLQALRGVVGALQSFGKFIPKALVRQLVDLGKGVQLGGEKRNLTVFFSDIQNFTNISEKIYTENLLVHLSEYFEEMTRVIQNNSGTLDKYIGDAIMAFWGAPLPDGQHAYNACKAALECVYRLDRLNQAWAEQEKPVLTTRFGINSGQMLVGNMGSSDRLQYTILGDDVNLGSRLESLNKVYGTRILVSERTYSYVQDHFVFRPVDFVAVKGKNKGVQIYELMAFLSQNTKQNRVSLALNLALRTAEAYNFYKEREWAQALQAYKKIYADFHGDPLAKVFIDRCEHFLQNPPGIDWDGIIRMQSK